MPSGLAVLQRRLFASPSAANHFFRGSTKRLKDLLHHSPRDFGKERGRVDVGARRPGQFRARAHRHPVSSEIVRRALKRLKTNWKRAKHWITSPDPQYLLKKTLATA